MKTPFKTIVLFLCLLSPAYSWAGRTLDYSFDTVTEINLDFSYKSHNPSISGIEKDTGEELTVIFTERSNDFKYRVNRCVPIFITAMEKPGRYYLHLTVNPPGSSPGLVSCRLEVKN